MSNFWCIAYCSLNINYLLPVLYDIFCMSNFYLATRTVLQAEASLEFSVDSVVINVNHFTFHTAVDMHDNVCEQRYV